MEAVLASALANLGAQVAASHALVSHDPLPKVMGDRSQLIQLLQNLLSNAIKYRRVDVAPEISICSERNGAWATVLGPGQWNRNRSEALGKDLCRFSASALRARYSGSGIVWPFAGGSSSATVERSGPNRLPAGHHVRLYSAGRAVKKRAFCCPMRMAAAAARRPPQRSEDVRPSRRAYLVNPAMPLDLQLSMSAHGGWQLFSRSSLTCAPSPSWVALRNQPQHFPLSCRSESGRPSSPSCSGCPAAEILATAPPVTLGLM